MVHFFHSLLCFVFSRIFSTDQVVVPFVPSTRQLHTALYRRIERKRERERAHQSQTALVKLCNLINIDTCQFLSNEIFFFVLVVLFRGILGVCVASCGALVIVFMDFSPTNKRQKVFETHNATLLASALTKLFELSCCSMDSMDGKKRTTSKIIFNII